MGSRRWICTDTSCSKRRYTKGTRANSQHGGSPAYLYMLQRRFIRILLLSVSAATALFVIFVVLGGGTNTIALKQTSFMDGQNSKTASKPIPNLTTAAASALAEKLNATGEAQGSENIKQARAAAVTAAIDQTLKGFNPKSFFPAVDPSRFVTTRNTSRPAEEQYLRALLGILKNSGGQIPADPHDSTQLDFTLPLQSFTQALTALYALPVPVSLIKIHEQAITIASAQQNILTVVQRHKSDPLQAFLAAQSADLVIDHIEALQKDIVKYMDTNWSANS